MADLPDCLSVERHRDLIDRGHPPWIRRLIVGALVGVIVAALLGAIGQQDRVADAEGSRARLRVTAPERLRGGLLWRARIELRALRAITLPRLVLGPGFIEGMQINSIEPAPKSEAGRDGRIVLTYDALQRGERLVVWVQAQVDPTTLGRQDTSVELDDATRRLVRVPRTTTVLP